MSSACGGHGYAMAQYAQTTDLLNSLLDVVRDDAQHPLYSLVPVVGDLTNGVTPW